MQSQNPIMIFILKLLTIQIMYSLIIIGYRLPKHSYLDLSIITYTYFVLQLKTQGTLLSNELEIVA